MDSVVAGNITVITRTFTRPVGSVASVSPSTAQLAVTDQAGVSTALAAPTPSYNADLSEVTFVLEWLVPDDFPGGTYVMTTDVAGALVAAYQQAFYVIGRVVPVMPV